jgi:hypothetical protein
MYRKFQSEDLKGRDHLRNLGVDGDHIKMDRDSIPGRGDVGIFFFSPPRTDCL